MTPQILLGRSELARMGAQEHRRRAERHEPAVGSVLLTIGGSARVCWNQSALNRRSDDT